MNIKGLDYNTQRKKLLMPEYGREIQKMIDHAVSLTDRRQRQECAMTIVKLMEAKVPQLKENEDYEQTLWDHLYLMSQKQLDIDWPFDVSGAEKIHDKPKPMQLPKEGIALRHYGRLVEELLDKLKTMPAGEERDALTYFTANQMKRDLATWGHGSADDEKVANDIARYTDGVIQIDLNSFTFEKVVVSEENRRTKRKK
ncbi:MAG: DUF4290 domain-containing protein [Prevotella sp.]|nr:DUF4290 domain-containing protein [Prevotella sp.]